MAHHHISGRGPNLKPHVPSLQWTQAFIALAAVRPHTPPDPSRFCRSGPRQGSARRQPLAIHTQVTWLSGKGCQPRCVLGTSLPLLCCVLTLVLRGFPILEIIMQKNGLKKPLVFVYTALKSEREHLLTFYFFFSFFISFFCFLPGSPILLVSFI